VPTYGYECEACGFEFEEFQKMSDPPITKCPQCGRKKSRRVISGGAGVIFKGSGFYCNDYGKNRNSQKRLAEELAKKDNKK